MSTQLGQWHHAAAGEVRAPNYVTQIDYVEQREYRATAFEAVLRELLARSVSEQSDRTAPAWPTTWS